jgi:hypothetical protein
MNARKTQEPEVTQGERIPVSFRVTATLKERLDAAAEQSGRSQAQECELRLEKSFDHQDLLADALALAFGREIAGALLAAGTAMKAAGQWPRRPDRRQKWINDPVAFDQAVKAANYVLQALRPAGDPSPRSKDDDWWLAHSELLLLAVMRDRRGVMFDHEAEIVRSLLGPEIVKRIKVAEPKS